MLKLQGDYNMGSIGKIGKYIRERRTAKHLSMRELAEKTGISHTEIYRIEAGKRKYPSIRILTALAKALEIPDHIALQLAGYKSEDDGNTPIIEKLFPELKTEILRSTAQKVIDLLIKYNDLDDSDYEGLIEHIEMFWEYKRKKG